MSVKNKVPEIRFKGFSGEWVNNSIGEICGATFGGGTPSTNDKDFWQGEIPWIQSSDIKDGSVTSVTAKKYITRAAVKKSATKLISGNSIAIVTRVGVGKLSLMRGEYATSQDFLSLSDLKIDSQYAVYVIWKQLQIEKEQVQGTSIKGITKDELLGKCINYPETEPEQTAIGNTFQILDNLINQHQQKHDKLSNIKKAMLEKMFPKQGETIPEIRFKGFSGEWEEVSLSDFGVATSGTSIESEFTKDGKYKVISIGSYSENSVYTEQGIRASLSPKTESRVLNKNDLTMILNDKTLAGNIIGRVLLVEEDDSYVYNQRTQRIEPSSEYNPQFLYQFLNAPSVRKRIFKASQGNTQIYVNWSAISKLKYFIPKKDEQIVIGNYFQKLDVLIKHHQQQITKLNNIKQACLSKMFV